VLGKRRRGDDDSTDNDDGDVPDDVKRIPMPRDTPPPVPKEILDQWWARRRARRNARFEAAGGRRDGGDGAREGAREGAPRRREGSTEETSSSREPAARPPTPAPQKVYSSQPVLRDLRKEATVFMPASVRSRMAEAGAAGQREGGAEGGGPRAVEVEDADEDDEE
jgi:hypothetical protein